MVVLNASLFSCSDSYTPEKPSSGEAGTDDFLGAVPPASDAASEFVKDHKDSYLPEAGELRALSVGPVFDDFLAIGEPPKEDDKKDVPQNSDEKDSYTPQDSSAAKEERDSYTPQVSSAAKEDTVELTPPAEQQPSAERDSKSGSVHEHVHDHVHDHVHADGHVHDHVHDEVHATTPRPSSDEGDHDDEGADDEVDGDGVVSAPRPLGLFGNLHGAHCTGLTVFLFPFPPCTGARTAPPPPCRPCPHSLSLFTWFSTLGHSAIGHPAPPHPVISDLALTVVRRF